MLSDICFSNGRWWKTTARITPQFWDGVYNPLWK